MNTEAIYLLSDGRPDQCPKQILSQVCLNTKVPIHTISFNCNDTEANQFLNELAHETHGRYHYFNENDFNTDRAGIVPYESEDTYLLKLEIQNALKYLGQISNLREECLQISSSSSKVVEIKSSPAVDVVKEKGIAETLQDIQTLDWVLPETRLLLENQFRRELDQSKKGKFTFMLCLSTCQ